MVSPLKLGTAKIDITPSRSIPLAGFSHREGSFSGVSQRLYAKIWFFEQVDQDGRMNRALLVQADLIWWGSERMAPIRSKLAERWGVDETSVILHATHTHSGPQTSGRFTPSLGLPDEEYINELEDRLLTGIAEAQSRVEPVQVEKGTGNCRIGVHRRKEVNGEIVMAPNPVGPLDPDVTVVRFRTNAGTTKGVLVHYTCHPTTTGDNLVSSEFTGAAADAVEEALGGDAIVSYLQGCCGDIRPALFRGGEFYRGGANDVFALGLKLADEVIRVLRRPMAPLAASGLYGAQSIVRLPYKRLPDKSELLKAEQEPGILGEWARLLLENPDRLDSDISLELTFLHVAEGLSFLAMNAEMVVEYGLFIKQQTAGQVLPLAYSNGMIGYVPTEQQLAEGGYEAEGSGYYFGLPAPFDAGLERHIREGATRLIAKKSAIHSTLNP